MSDYSIISRNGYSHRLRIASHACLRKIAMLTLMKPSIKKGQYLVANVFWNISHNLQVGVEYLHGWRENFNDVNREANRINLSAQYNF